MILGYYRRAIATRYAQLGSPTYSRPVPFHARFTVALYRASTARKAGDVGSSVLGIHHVTAIAGDPQQNIDFYTEVLGLRLVKVTVDVHDPEAYHLVYGTGTGQPGTLLTFYCWPGAIRGRPGTGQVYRTALGIPPGSLGYWHDRLTSHKVAVDGLHYRDGLPSLSFRDPDGLLLDLVADEAVLTWEPPWWRPVPVDRATRGLYGITLWVSASSEWEHFLATALGLDIVAQQAHGCRVSVPGGGPGAHVVLRVMPSVGRGLTCVGHVHHAAFRVRDGELDDWRGRLAQDTGSLGRADDHVYYRALHLAGPEGMRLELASDGPGLTVDEPLAELGTHLVVPSWLGARRPELERRLPRIRLPGSRRLQ